MDIEKISNETIKLIKSLREKQISYDEILRNVEISKDELKRICRDLKLNKSSNRIKQFDKKEVTAYYLKVKSLRKTAIFFNSTRDTMRKYLDSDVIKDRRTKTKTASESVIEWRRKTKIKLVEYKGGKCECCGYDKCISALTFHHRNPEEKDFTISGKSYSFEKMKLEVDKCMIVCANCHIEIHDEIKLRSLKI